MHHRPSGRPKRQRDTEMGSMHTPRATEYTSPWPGRMPYILISLAVSLDTVHVQRFHIIFSPISGSPMWFEAEYLSKVLLLFLISYSTLCHDSQRGNDINLISTEAANYLLEDISLTTTTQRPYWSLIIMFQRVMHCSRTISERNPNLPMEFGHVVSEYQRTLLPPNSLVTKDLSSVGR